MLFLPNYKKQLEIQSDLLNRDAIKQKSLNLSEQGLKVGATYKSHFIAAGSAPVNTLWLYAKHNKRCRATPDIYVAYWFIWLGW